MLKTRWLAVLALCAGVALWAPGVPAEAQETPGYDPNTPAGVEYQLPLERTRREATGRKADPTRTGRPGRPIPLFGAGVRDEARPSSGEESGGPGAGRSGSDESPGGDMADAKDSDDRNEGGPGAVASKSGANDDDDDDDQPLELGLAGGVLAVILGAAVGLVVRFRSRGSAT